MVEIDKAALDAQMAKFSVAVAAKTAYLQAGSAEVMLVEANRLTQTLMRITPPAGEGALAKARQKIDADVHKKFGLLENVDTAFPYKFNPPVDKQGNGGTLWFLWNSGVLMGVADDADKRGASVDEIYKTYWNAVVSKSGRLNEGSRGKQKIRIIKRHIFEAKTVRALIKRLQFHLGRIKAGWAVSWVATGSLTGIYKPPQWVTKHLEKGTPRGRADVSKLNGPVPEVSIANFAKGADSPGMRQIAFNALRIRMEAIPRRLAQMVRLSEKHGTNSPEFRAMLMQEGAL